MKKPTDAMKQTTMIRQSQRETRTVYTIGQRITGENNQRAGLTMRHRRQKSRGNEKGGEKKNRNTTELEKWYTKDKILSSCPGLH